jgi:hypothetical protein
MLNLAIVQRPAIDNLILLCMKNNRAKRTQEEIKEEGEDCLWPNSSYGCIAGG